MSRLSFILFSLLLMLMAAPTALAAPVAEGGGEPLPWLWWLGPIGSVIAFVFVFINWIGSFRSVSIFVMCSDSCGRCGSRNVFRFLIIMLCSKSGLLNNCSITVSSRIYNVCVSGSVSSRSFCMYCSLLFQY